MIQQLIVQGALSKGEDGQDKMTYQVHLMWMENGDIHREMFEGDPNEKDIVALRAFDFMVKYYRSKVHPMRLGCISDTK